MAAPHTIQDLVRTGPGQKTLGRTVMIIVDLGRPGLRDLSTKAQRPNTAR
jgi:hypothetical protein